MTGTREGISRYTILVEKSERYREVERYSGIWVFDVKLDFEVIYQVVGWICVFQDRDQWRAFLHRNQIRIPRNDGNIMTEKRNIITQQAFSTLELGS
jgi:hypothetical protein